MLRTEGLNQGAVSRFYAMNEQQLYICCTIISFSGQVLAKSISAQIKENLKNLVFFLSCMYWALIPRERDGKGSWDCDLVPKLHCCPLLFLSAKPTEVNTK